MLSELQRKPMADAQALFAEARRRRRRRRLVLAGSIGMALTVGAAIGLAVGRPDAAPMTAHAKRPSPPRAVTPRPFRLAPAVVAWVGSTVYSTTGGLHVGNVSNLTQRVVATINDDNDDLVQAGGQIYWEDGRSIWTLDLRTGARRWVAFGQWVTASASGRDLYVAHLGHLRNGQVDTLAVIPVNGHGPRPLYSVPAGWQLDNYPNVAVANGLMVNSYSRMRIGLWDLQTGRVRKPIGMLQEPIGAYTPPGADYSLLAWLPDDCRKVNCPIGITNTVSLATVTVNSPYRYGFLGSPSGVAFSPDGSQLAVFVNLANGDAEPALITTKTGAIRLVPRIHLYTTELASWVAWLGAGSQLLVGAYANYAIDARTLASRPFYFFGQPGYGPDISFSATAIPTSALSQRTLRALGLRQ